MREFETLGNHNFDCIAFSPDSKQLAGCGGPKGVRIWDVETAEVKFHFPLGKIGAHGHTLHFSPNGKILAVQNLNTAAFHNLESKKITILPAALRPARNTEVAVHGSIFSPDGKLIYYGETITETPGGTGTQYITSLLKSRDTKTGKEKVILKKFEFKASYRSFSRFAISADGKMLYCGTAIVDLVKGVQLKGPEQPFFNAGLSPDGKTLVSQNTGTLLVYDTESWKLLLKRSKEGSYSLGECQHVAPAFTSDLRSIVTPDAGSSFLSVFDVAHTMKERGGK